MRPRLRPRLPTARCTERRLGAVLPHLRLHVALAADQDVDHGAVVEVLGEKLGRYAALEQRPALLQLFGQHGEQGVLLDAFEDLLLVVQGEVAGDGAGKAARGFFALLADVLDGKSDVRQFYFATAMPSLRDSGLPLKIMIGGSARVLFRVAHDLVGSVSPEVRPAVMAWLYNFLGEHLADVVTVWEQKD